MQFAGGGIACFQVTRHVDGISAHSNDDVVIDHHGGAGGEVLHFLVRDLLAEALLPGLGVEREEPAIGRHEIQPVAIHAEAAVSHQVAAVVYPLSFVSEHSETLVELDIEYRHLASQKGVPTYVRVPAVGTHPLFIAGLARLVRISARSDQPALG